jgi:hypothetical protein
MIPRKQVFLFSILFFVLAISLFYYALTNTTKREEPEKPLRLDTVPGDAYVVPWMRPNPSIDELNPQMPYGPPTFDIESVMAGALKLNITFSLNLREINSTVYLGHDSDYLYIGGKFRGMYTNPASDENVTVPNFFEILFDVDHDGVLKNPESGSRFCVYIDRERVSLMIYHDMVWAFENDWDARFAWLMSSSYYTLLGKQLPAVAMKDETGEYDNSTGTVTMLWSRYLNFTLLKNINALQMRPDERWVMGFLPELGYITNTGHYQDYVDGWPRRIYPYLSNDSSWWPKLAIDLSNPPPSFSV